MLPLPSRAKRMRRRRYFSVNHMGVADLVLLHWTLQISTIGKQHHNTPRRWAQQMPGTLAQDCHSVSLVVIILALCRCLPAPVRLAVLCWVPCCHRPCRHPAALRLSLALRLKTCCIQAVWQVQSMVAMLLFRHFAMTRSSSSGMRLYNLLTRCEEEAPTMYITFSTPQHVICHDIVTACSLL